MAILGIFGFSSPRPQSKKPPRKIFSWLRSCHPTLFPPKGNGGISVCCCCCWIRDDHRQTFLSFDFLRKTNYHEEIRGGGRQGKENLQKKPRSRTHKEWGGRGGGGTCIEGEMGKSFFFFSPFKIPRFICGRIEESFPFLNWMEIKLKFLAPFCRSNRKRGDIADCCSWGIMLFVRNCPSLSLSVLCWPPAFFRTNDVCEKADDEGKKAAGVVVVVWELETETPY